MHSDSLEFLKDIRPLLIGLYALAGGMNAMAAWQARRRGGWPGALVWLGTAALFFGLAAAAWGGRPLAMPETLKDAIDAGLGPVSVAFGAFAAFSAVYVARRFFVRPWVAWSGLNLSLVFLGASLTDTEFASIVLEPDNVPIVGMIYLLGFFAWLALAQAVENDSRHAADSPPVEKCYAETTLVWPDLVYVELIAVVLLMTGLIVWSILLRAPLEQPANPVVTPNPSKAPWYFLGLQEMLVYFDPAVAGVILPTLIIIGLAAIPYLDVNPAGNGFYSLAPRKFAAAVFLFGFLQLWILLILIGTFLRGPNWSFYGLYEPRDRHKAAVVKNVKLSEYFWSVGLRRGAPEAAAGSGPLRRFGYALWREIAGLAAMGLYFVLLPVVLAKTVFRDYLRQMGRCRYALMAFLLLMMFSLPLKMILRWTANLSYFVSMPEYFVGF